MQNLESQPSGTPEPPTEAPLQPNRLQRPRERALALLPWLTVALVLANVSVEVAAARLGGTESTPTLIFLGAKVNSLIEAGDYWRLVSANFLHVGWWHLAANMVGLFSLGWLVELFYGRPRFLILYTLTAVAGAIASYEFLPGISAGASTAVFGLMGVVAAHNLKYRRYLPPAMLARMGLIFPLILLQLVLAAGKPEIDVNGHVGGLIAGFLLGLITDSRVAGPLQGQREWLPFPAALATAAGLLVYGLAGWAINVPRQTPLLLAGIAEGRGHEERAIRLYELAVRRQPELVEARAELAVLLVRQQRWEEAGALFEQLAREHPGKATYGEVAAQALQQAATAAQQRGDVRQSVGLLRLAVRAAPAGPARAQAQNNLAYLLADKLNSELPEARRLAEAATQAMPDEPNLVDTLAWVRYRMGDFAEAERLQRGAAREKKGDPEVRYHLGAILEAQGKTAEAIAEYEAAVRASNARTDPDAEAAVRMAREGQKRLGGK